MSRNRDLAALGKASIASNTEVVSAADGDLLLVADHVEDAVSEVALSETANNVALDWDSAVNFTLTFTAADEIWDLSNPTNGQPGTWRYIRVIQHSSGNDTLTFDTAYLFPGGAAPILTPTASAIDTISIYCVNTTIFYAHANYNFS
jgi:hypothetical protein